MTRVIRRTSMIQSPVESGSTLVACSLVMFGVALLTSAALRSLEDRISLTHNAVDRRLAQQAAEAALHDAALTLAMIPDRLTLAEVQGTHRIGEMTGDTYVYGGYLQPCVLPEYVLEVISPSDINPIYRVTAQGKGYSDTTTVVLQADFAVQLCKTDSDASQTPAQEAEQGQESNRGQSAEQSTEPSVGRDSEGKPVECVPGVRWLAWRLLQAT